MVFLFRSVSKRSVVVKSGNGMESESVQKNIGVELEVQKLGTPLHSSLHQNRNPTNVLWSAPRLCSQ